MRRWLMAGVITIALPIAGTVALAGPALAGSPSVTGVSCTKLSGKVNLGNDSAKIKLKGCSDPTNTGGKGKTSGSESSTTATIKWKGTGTTTEDNVTNTAVSPDACPGTDIEEESTADVTGGTGEAAESIMTGWTVQAFVCFNSTTDEISLLPGTTYNIGPSY